MWTDLTTVETTLDCKPPFSFYFDLIEPHWKAGPSNNLPLHRICTLARKQGAAFVVVETALGRTHVRDEITALDDAHGGGGAAEALAISFFSGELEPSDIDLLDERSFLGQAILVNYRKPGSSEFSHSYLFEAVLPPPTLPGAGDNSKLLLNNYISSDKDFECVVRGRTFSVRAIYYCQQNRTTHVCAHASLKMALSSKINTTVTSQYINQLLAITPPCDGLSLGNVVKVIEAQGLSAEVVDCTNVERESYISILASIIESGDQALLVFTTGHLSGGVPQEHVVLVYGHTRNSDEWHPQAIPAYAGPGSAKYLPASNWIDHFLIHDDNFGPYYALSSQALEFDPDVKAHWIVAIRQSSPMIRPDGAETIAATILTNLLPSLAPLASGRWFDYVTKTNWAFVLRTLLVTKAEYIDHLTAARGHDASAASPADLLRLAVLPNQFWMVEFSLPALFTGNRTKLGEVIVAAQSTLPVKMEEVVLALRLPKLLIVQEATQGKLVHDSCALDSHVSIYRRPVSGPEW